MSGASLRLGTEFDHAVVEVARVMRLLSNPRRLRILCKLAEGEKSVGQLTADLAERQSGVSQQLALLKQDGLVAARREGQWVFYSLSDPNIRRLMELLYELYCPKNE